MKRLTKEFLVGALVLLVISLMLGFGWLMGVLGPFSKDFEYQVNYAFAGGVEIGSPVRVSGVKVGKGEKIEFLQSDAENDSDPTNLRITITVSPVAAQSVRKTSRFYVNMAGIIGERYIEITPGDKSSELLPRGSVVRGIDPPRIDQLLSQGYGVFGKIQEFLEQNEKSVTDFVKSLDSLLRDANKLLRGEDKRKFFQLVDNLNEMSTDLKFMVKDLRDPESKEIFKQLAELVRRAHQVDKAALKKFLQEEGVRARIF